MLLLYILQAKSDTRC